MRVPSFLRNGWAGGDTLECWSGVEFQSTDYRLQGDLMGDILKFRSRAMLAWGRWWRLKQLAAAANNKGTSEPAYDAACAEEARPSSGRHHLLDGERDRN
jgi:hypothetical protein